MNFHISYPLVLSYFDENRIFSTDFGKKSQNFMKIRPVGAALYRADGRTDGRTDRHDEANTCSSQFRERSK